MERKFEDELQRELERMKPEDREKVLGFAKALGCRQAGKPGRAITIFGGVIPSDDLQQMAAVIEEGCEKVDSSGW